MKDEFDHRQKLVQDELAANFLISLFVICGRKLRHLFIVWPYLTNSRMDSFYQVSAYECR